MGPDDTPWTLLEELAAVLEQAESDAASMGCNVSYYRSSQRHGFFIKFDVVWGDKDPLQLHPQPPGPDGPVVIRG
ncbi:MAG: hypothetical protein JOY55_07085 [Mycobacterium sp.]|nr:hypothetical protein [Mycobacterium sp.]